MNKDNKMISEVYFNVLCETFDSSYTISHGKDYDPPDMYSYVFDSDKNKKYEVNFEIVYTGVYQFEFKEEIDLDPDNPNFYAGYKITGSGDEFKVFSTVINTVRIFLNELKSDGIKFKRLMFSAEKDEPSRIKLYDRLLKTLSSKNYLDYQIREEEGGLINYNLYPLNL